MAEEDMDVDQNLGTLPERTPRLWALLAVDLEFAKPEEASHKILGVAPLAGASRTDGQAC
jgi:hypothetical protein